MIGKPVASAKTKTLGGGGGGGETNCSICIRCVELTEESKWASSLPVEVHQRMSDVLGGPSSVTAKTLAKS